MQNANYVARCFVVLRVVSFCCMLLPVVALLLRVVAGCYFLLHCCILLLISARYCMLFHFLCVLFPVSLDVAYCCMLLHL